MKILIQKSLLLCLLTLGCLLQVSAQHLQVTGRIADANNKGIGFAIVYIPGTGYGTSANEQGVYQLKLVPGSYRVVFRNLGYHELAENIVVKDHNLVLNTVLASESNTLNLPASTAADSGRQLILKVLAKSSYFHEQEKSYANTTYIKGIQKLVSAPKSLMNANVSNALSIDSSGKGILYQTESIWTFSHRSPIKVREERLSKLSAGQNAVFSYDKASDLSQNFYRDILTIPGLSSHGFISPLGKRAFSYYKYQLAGSELENGKLIYKIGVIPKRTHGPVFTGYIYLTAGDLHLYAIDLLLTDKANKLNQLDSLRIRQQYVPIRENSWQPLTIQYSFNGSVLVFKYEGFYLGVYSKYQLDPPFTEKFFNGERLRIDSNANESDLNFWQGIRPVPLTSQESSDYANKSEIANLKKAMAQFGEQQGSNNRFKSLPYLLYGYKASYKQGRDSLYAFPFLQTLFYNTVEGAGINLQASYSHHIDSLHSFTLTPNIRYGFANKLMNANLRGEYIYDPNNLGKITGGFGSDLLDLSNVGTRSLYFNTLSTLLSEQNFVKYYRSEFINGGFQRQLVRGLLLKTELSLAQRTQLYNNSYYSIDTYKGRHLTSNNPLAADSVAASDRSLLFPQNKALTFTAALTYTINQEYINRPGGREYLQSNYPQIKLTYRKGIKGPFGANADYDFTSLTIYQEHLNTGLLGYSSFKIEAGSFLNNSKVYFMDYNHFQGNQGTTFDPTPGSFHFLPFYSYSTRGPYFEAHYEHNFSGFFFSRIPLLRSLKLDEIAGINYLSENNNYNYSEFFIGVKHSIFRVDYGVSYQGTHKYLQGFRIYYGIK